jgi:hypothetical protein
MHNGGAYGDGTTESGAGIECGAAGTTGKHGQFTLASGGAGDWMPAMHLYQLTDKELEKRDIVRILEVFIPKI